MRHFEFWKLPILAIFHSNDFVRQQSSCLDPTNNYWDILRVRQIVEMPWELNVSELLSVTNSRWTALAVMHVNMITCASFSVFLPIRICRGPNMSISVLLNAGKPAVTRSLGIWPIDWLRNFLQVTHLPVTCLAMFRTPMFQKCFLDSYMRLLQPQCARFSWRCFRSRLTDW